MQNSQRLSNTKIVTAFKHAGHLYLFPLFRDQINPIQFTAPFYR